MSMIKSEDKPKREIAFIKTENSVSHPKYLNILCKMLEAVAESESAVERSGSDVA